MMTKGIYTSIALVHKSLRTLLCVNFTFHFCLYDVWALGLQFPDKPNYSTRHSPDHRNSSKTRPELPEATGQLQSSFFASVTKSLGKASQACSNSVWVTPMISGILEKPSVATQWSQDNSSSHLPKVFHKPGTSLNILQTLLLILIITLKHVSSFIAQKSGFQGALSQVSQLVGRLSVSQYSNGPWDF